MSAFTKAPRLGRPRELTKQIIEDVANALRAGAYIETAVALSGIHKDTFYSWLKRGKAFQEAEEPNMDDALCGAFSDAVRLAMAQAEMRDILVIDRAANGIDEQYDRRPDGTLVLDERGRPVLLRKERAADWSAAAWRLERKYPKKWAKTEKTMEVDGHDDTDGGSTSVTFVKSKKNGGG